MLLGQLLFEIVLSFGVKTGGARAAVAKFICGWSTEGVWVFEDIESLLYHKCISFQLQHTSGLSSILSNQIFVNEGLFIMLYEISLFEN